MIKKILQSTFLIAVFLFSASFISMTPAQAQVENPQSDAAGLTGTVVADPPTQGATISFPTNGQSFTESEIDVTGVCPNGLLVKLFKNEVFAGSAVCTGGSFTITIDLFSGDNQLVARVFDDLDQPGPDSNLVTVTFDDVNSAIETNRVALTTNFAKRGANPGSTLSWPMTITGGTGPYAVTIDWGDGEETLLSLDLAGEFIPEHIYTQAGTYRIIVKAVDANGTTSFLQLVGVANGAVQDQQPARIDDEAAAIQAANTGGGLQFVIWPLYVMIFLIFSTFWLGRRYEIKKLKKKLAQQQSLS